MSDLVDEIARVFDEHWVDHETHDTVAAAKDVKELIIARIPPLVWPTYAIGHTYQSAKPIVYGRPYNVRKYTKVGWKAFYDDQPISATFDTIEAAKAAANAHHVAQLCKGMGIE